MSDKLRQVALGIVPAETVLKNAKIVNVFNSTIETADIAIEEGIIAGIGNYEGRQEIDLCFSFVAPGLIDGHVHIESSMLTPSEFAKIVLPRGTTTVIADPHEIANVCGLNGIRFILDSAKTTPLEVKIMIPSCVPATAFETSGYGLTAAEIGALKNEESILGLGEMMDYPGLLAGRTEVIRKVEAMDKGIRDGHAPGLSGHELNAYKVMGIHTDHESTTRAEIEEKIARGFYCHLREGSATRNLAALLPAVNQKNLSRLLFCTDDKHPGDIIREGHIDYNVNQAIQAGIAPIDAIRMATINTAIAYQLPLLGAIAPGYQADLIVFDSLEDIKVRDVYKRGIPVVKSGKILFETVKIRNHQVLNTIHFNPESIDLSLALKSDRIHVIGLENGNVTTSDIHASVKVKNGLYVAEENPDLWKLAVVERHHYSGRIGKALVKGFGLHHGALAMSIAHDSHNVIAIGDNDPDMLLAIKTIKGIGGGIVLVHEHDIYDYLRLEVGGIMTANDPRLVAEKITIIENKCRQMGVSELIDPLLTLSFLSLPVIPKLKLTDHGLVDVERQQLIPLEIN
ncbi:MAG: adenine deaminase [Candidatus Izemoplasmatales bacterium]|nr:adenine deaminase [Candidatus Izemoplasmatales bacterium]